MSSIEAALFNNLAASPGETASRKGTSIWLWMLASSIRKISLTCSGTSEPKAVRGFSLIIYTFRVAVLIRSITSPSAVYIATLVSPPQSERKPSPNGRLVIAQLIALNIADFPASDSPMITFVPGTNSSIVFLCDWKFSISTFLIMLNLPFQPI